MFGMDRLLASVIDDLCREIETLMKEKEKKTAPKRPDLKCRVVVYEFGPDHSYIKAEPDKEEETKEPEAPAEEHSVPATDPTSFTAYPAFGLFRPYIDRDDDVCIQIGPQKFYMHKEDARTLYAKISQELRRAKRAEKEQE